MITNEPVQLPLPFAAGITPAARAELHANAVEGWAERSACRGDRRADDWFDEDPTSPAARRVARVCAGCPVARACLAAALSSDETGIWGGTTDDQRADLLAQLGDGRPVDLVLSLDRTGRRAAA